MPGAMTYDEAVAAFPHLEGMSGGELRVRLSELTNMTEPEWEDFFSLPPEAKAVAVLNYAAAVWVETADTFAEVLAVLTVLATIAGAVSGVAGAASAVAALRAL